MKKSLIALAALATVATAAQAQSSVTIYGIVDLGYASISHVGPNGKTVSGLQNGNLSTSRLGFRGVEDLGGGLKAGFTLEAEILADTGAQTTTQEALFARQSSVFLGGNWGEVKLGRFDSLDYALGAKFDPMGANNLGGHIATGSSAVATRLENAVQYSSPTWNGLKVSVQTGTKTQKTDATSGAPSTVYGEVAGQFSGNRAYDGAIEYTNGKLELAVTQSAMNTAIGVSETKFNSYLARYDFGVARVAAGFTETKTTNSGKKVQKTFIGVNVPVSATVTVNGFAAQVDTDTGTASTSFTPKVYALGANYALSKRTTLYVLGAMSNQDGASEQIIANAGKWNYSNNGTFTLGTAPGGSNKDQTAYAVGIRHTF